MPPKKNTSVQKAAGDTGPVLPEGSDPVQAAVTIIDKKVRNLEKRKVGNVHVQYYWGKPEQPPHTCKRHELHM